MIRRLVNGGRQPLFLVRSCCIGSCLCQDNRHSFGSDHAADNVGTDPIVDVLSPTWHLPETIPVHAYHRFRLYLIMHFMHFIALLPR